MDLYACFAPNTSLQFKASEWDPFRTGYVIAVAVDANGLPTQANVLIGNAFVNENTHTSTGSYVGTYDAVAFKKITPGSASNGTIKWGTDYDAVPNQFSMDIQSPADSSGQRIVTAGLNGNLNTGGLSGCAQVGKGQVYNQDNIFSDFQNFVTGTCLCNGVVTATTPDVPGGLLALIPSGRMGTLKFSVTSAVGLIMTPQNSTNKRSRISALPKTGVAPSAANGGPSLTIPVFPAACLAANGSPSLAIPAFTSTASSKTQRLIRANGPSLSISSLLPTCGSEPTCSLACNATVPSTGEVNKAISFSGTATPTGCTGTPTYNWDFGDGTPHSTQQNPSHTYTKTGTYTWRMIAEMQGAPFCMSSGSITVSPAPPPETPTLMNVIPLSTPIPDKKFLAKLIGSNFDPTTLQIIVTGPSCPNIGSCIIPNNVLIGKSNAQIESAPFTLKQGDYTIYVRNGNNGPLSTKSVKLTVDALQLTPILSKITPSVSPVVGQMFSLKLEGNGFDPATIQVLVNGASCSSCVLTNKSATQLTTSLKLDSVGTYQISVRNGNTGTSSKSQLLSVFQQTPTTFTLSGNLGIVDERWPFDGSGVSVTIELFKSNSTEIVKVKTGIVDGSYILNDVPSGIYDLQATVKYAEAGGALKNPLTKWAKRMERNIQINTNTVKNMYFPPVVVMVHGILSGYEKWYGRKDKNNNDNETIDRSYANSYWDQYLRYIGTSEDTQTPEGFITITPDYWTNVPLAGGWPKVATYVYNQINDTITTSLTKRNNNRPYPPSYYIGHSQGGLVGRVIVAL